MILQKSIYTILFIPFIHSVDILKAILSIHTRGGKRSLNYAQKLRIWFSTWGERHWKFTSFQKARIPEKSISFIPGTRLQFGPCTLPTQHALKNSNYSTKDCGSLETFSSLTWGSGESTPTRKIFTSRSMGNETSQHGLCPAQYFSVPNLLSAMRFIPSSSCTML